MTNSAKRHAKEGRGPRWVRIDERIHTSPAWRTLSGSAVKMWVTLRGRLDGHNNGKLAPTFATLRPLGWTSNGPRVRALAELIERGFLAYTRRCGPNVFHRASLVRFTDIPTPADEADGIVGHGPTDDFLRWQPEPTKPRFASSVPRTLKGSEPYRITDDEARKPYRITDDGENVETSPTAGRERKNSRRAKTAAVVRAPDIHLGVTKLGSEVGAVVPAFDPDLPPSRPAPPSPPAPTAADRIAAKLAALAEKEAKREAKAASKRKTKTATPDGSTLQ